MSSRVRRLARRCIAALLCVTLAWTPFALTWAQPFPQPAQDASTTHEAFATNFARPDLSGTTLTLNPGAPGEQVVSLQDLFPGMDAAAPPTALYDDDPATAAAGTAAQAQLSTEDSAQGEAYRTVAEDARAPQSLHANDEIFTSLDTVSASLDTFASDFTDCERGTTVTHTTRTVWYADLKTCDRVEYYGPYTAHVDHPFGHDPATGLYADAAWSPPDDLIIAQLTGYGICDGTNTCLDLAPTPVDTDGEPIPPPGLGPSPIPGVSNLCRAVATDTGCYYNRGNMDCWVDPQGTTQCPYNEGDIINSCGALEGNPACSYVSTDCLLTAPNGVCLVWEDTHDCGESREVPVAAQQSSYACPGPMACMGGECATPAETPSAEQDFIQASQLFEAAQEMGSDAICPTPDTCAVFEGDALECKKAVGGYIDCCEKPDGVGLGEYISLLLAMRKVDTAILGIDTAATGALGTLRGSWETLRTPFTYAGNAWDAATEAIATGVDSITGGAASTVSEATKGLSIEAFKQSLLNTTAEWVGQVFGAQAQAALFTNVGGTAAAGAGAGGGAVVGGTFSLAPLIASALTVIMWAYLIYTIVTILIQLIWKCEEDEFALGARRQLRTCHKVGSYCKTGFFGICIEKRQAYCCFNSPLARIIQEQVHQQLHIGWGSGEDPNCAGLTTGQLSAVDWSLVDMGEWLAMLEQTGNLPDPTNITIDNLTGAGNVMNDGTRQNTAVRTGQRLQGIDANAVRANAAADFQGAIP